MTEPHPRDTPKGRPVLVRRDEAEVLGTAPGTMTLLADASATSGFLSSSRTALGRGKDGATPHYHRASAEMFFILDGRLQVLIGDEVVTAREGDLLVVPPHTPHAFAAPPDSAADVLIVLTPGVDRFDYFRLLDRIRHGQADPQEVLRTQERFDNHFVDNAAWSQARSASKT
ncbi:cupin domain-containing protein [Actinomadura sp. KC06]|uniref:cupin domain-containing protein n=1 Tax=Actinomadura sp. KC06 TaxID=2530369 RepID=UPI00104B96D0|nr:cupin domain-containing protein [Actinomadura sp. KC06]TDD34134.1 cupin domain-containing protein [Actinomadura sp. KC06]